MGEQEAMKQAEKTGGRGLDAVLQSLQAAKKVNVLDKSRQDWSGYKKDHTHVRFVMRKWGSYVSSARERERSITS